jgi:hypothetical protein
VGRAAAAGQRLVDRQSLHRNQAQCVLLALQEKCLFCKDRSCDGEQCMAYGSCFTCGRGHLSKHCTDKKTPRAALVGIACYQCFDLYERHGCQPHDAANCPLKRRLRRLIFTKTSDASLAVVLGKIYSTQDAFHEFLATFEPV